MRTALTTSPVLPALFALALGCSSSAQPDASSPQDAALDAPTSLSARLQGAWASGACLAVPQPTGTIYLKLAFTFAGSTWQHTTEVYGDAACTARLLSAEIGGAYELGAASGVAGATEATFHIASIRMTPRSPAYVGALTAQHCGSGMWAVDAAQDVTQTGCLFYPSVTACAQEYDLVSLASDGLHFGRRPTDGTDLCAPARRPTALDPNPFTRAM